LRDDVCGIGPAGAVVVSRDVTAEVDTLFEHFTLALIAVEELLTLLHAVENSARPQLY
jgi:hypothetical protein